MLLRQLRKKFKGELTEEMVPLLLAVNQTYNFYEEDRKLIERSMDISSRESSEANEKLSKENEAHKKMMGKLQKALLSSNKKEGVDVTQLDINSLVDALIEARDAAEHSAKIKEQFLGNMSHEIRTPMNGVIGMTNLLLQTELTDEQLEYISSIKFSADNLLVIINDILDLTKIESGKIELDPTPFSLEEVVNGVIKTIKYKTDEKGLKIRRSIDADLPNVVIGDPVRYNQVLLNLVGNAIKFTEVGGIEINISVEEANDNHLIISTEIKDSGIGILEGKLEKIFESFTQAMANTTRKYGGTGLGLAISKQLVELQEGEFFVESKMGEGSSFRFSLPFVKSNSLVKLGREDNPTTGNVLPSGTKVLLVEDNPINVKVATKLLGKWNTELEVDHAENGEVALEMLRENDYSLILMDLHMPVMDGYEASKAIRNDLTAPKCNTPIIAVSASAFKSDEQKVMDAGMNGFVSKPFVPQELFRTMVAQVERKRA